MTKAPEIPVKAQYAAMKQELQNLAQKIGELEQETEEHK